MHLSACRTDAGVFATVPRHALGLFRETLLFACFCVEGGAFVPEARLQQDANEEVGRRATS
jgi:hypothetical protein